MQIAFIAHLSEVSGAGVALVEAAAGLSADFETCLILPGPGPLESLAANRKLQTIIISNPQVSLNESTRAAKVRLAVARARYVWRLRQFLREKEISLAYINSSASVFPAFAARLAGVPIAWHIHETLSSPAKSVRLKKRIISWLADGLIYASKSGMQNFPPPLGTPAMLARNYVPLSALSQIASRRHRPETDHPRILLNGTYRLKGADVLLEAVTKLAETGPGMQPYVEITGPAVASESYYFDLVKTAEQPPLQGRVEFSGLQQGLAGALARADVFVSASRTEALPISIVEAMAARVPVIATDVGDCADLLDYGKCGWVVPPEAPDALAAALHEVLSQPDVAAAKSQNAFAKVANLYHEENFWDPLRTFLSDLVSRHR